MTRDQRRAKARIDSMEWNVVSKVNIVGSTLIFALLGFLHYIQG